MSNVKVIAKHKSRPVARKPGQQAEHNYVSHMDQTC